MNLDYDEVSATAGFSDVIFSPVEMHGILSGLLVVDEAVPEAQFLACIVSNEQQSPAAGAIDVLRKLHHETRELLGSNGIEFEPLLPDDEYPLIERFNAASSWARGFIVGLAKQGVSADKIVSADVSQFIHDLTEISNSEYEVEESEESELIYVELVEYLRMGALLLQEELQPQVSSQPLH